MMHPFAPRNLVNGGLLRQFIGKNVTIMLRVDDESKTSLKSISTDGQSIAVSLPEPLGARKGNWIEVIGTPTGTDTLKAKEAIFFGEGTVEFDVDAYNMLVLFMNNCMEIYKHG